MIVIILLLLGTNYSLSIYVLTFNFLKMEKGHVLLSSSKGFMKSVLKCAKLLYLNIQTTKYILLKQKISGSMPLLTSTHKHKSSFT